MASALSNFVMAQLSKAYRRKLVELGYWCPDCDIEALPFPCTDETPLDGGNGWCPICGRTPQIAT